MSDLYLKRKEKTEAREMFKEFGFIHVSNGGILEVKNILIIDDSALIRRVISDIIKADERFQVKDVARDGLEGLNLILRNKKEYDAVILDINMPKMNGLELLEEIARAKIKIPVIVVSTMVREGASETIRALELGAFDFLLKPDSYAEVKEEDFSKSLLEKLYAATKISSRLSGKENVKPFGFSDRDFAGMRSNVKTRELIHPRLRTSSNGKVLVALACSTGGPKALQMLIPMLPAKIGAGMLIVQHMPGGFTLSLANRLQETSVINVKEAAEGDVIVENQVYLAKGGYQMKVTEQSRESFLSLTKDAPRGGLRPCADIMYESLTGSAYEKIVCVVLTGMGSDATEGIKQLKQTNNVYVIAQDEATSTVYGMPRAVAESGLADEVLPLEQIADAIVKATGVR